MTLIVSTLPKALDFEQWLVGWLFGISILVGYFTPNPIHTQISKKFVRKILNKTELICLFTVKWFHIFLSNTNNSIYC